MFRFLHARFFVTLIAAALPWHLHAQMTIEVTGAGARQFPIAITTFPGEAALPESLTQIVRADLERSGLFRLVDTAGIAPVPTEPAQVRFADWKARNADFLALPIRDREVLPRLAQRKEPSDLGSFHGVPTVDEHVGRGRPFAEPNAQRRRVEVHNSTHRGT